MSLLDLFKKPVKHYTGQTTCQCGCGLDMQPEGIRMVGQVADYLFAKYGITSKLNSGARCRKHNAAVGGAPGSMHPLGLAADWAIAYGVDRYRLVQAAIDLKIPRLTLYATKAEVHMDIGGAVQGVQSPDLVVL